MSSDLMAYFGYGSLVNLGTLQTDYVSACPAKLTGWRRHWQSYAGEGANRALLSVHRNKHCEIAGMLVIDRIENLPALDVRETHYERVDIPIKALKLFSSDVDLSKFKPERLFVYVANRHDDAKPPLLQSYLDAVMAGFYEHYGEAGIREFLSTTIGFDRPIIADRKEPNYPRAVAVGPTMARWFDSLLKEAGVEFQ